MSGFGSFAKTTQNQTETEDSWWITTCNSVSIPFYFRFTELQIRNIFNEANNDLSTPRSLCLPRHCFQRTCGRCALLHCLQCRLRRLPLPSWCHSWRNRTSYSGRLVLRCSSRMCRMLAGSGNVHGCLHPNITQPNTVVPYPPLESASPSQLDFLPTKKAYKTLVAPVAYFESIILRRLRRL